VCPADDRGLGTAIDTGKRNSNPSNIKFDDVNLRGIEFHEVAYTGDSICDAYLAGYLKNQSIRDDLKALFGPLSYPSPGRHSRRDCRMNCLLLSADENLRTFQVSELQRSTVYQPATQWPNVGAHQPFW
jgi:hypothetical protein